MLLRILRLALLSLEKKKRYFIFLMALGIFLRLCAFSWNSIIQGDVNLFALSAREYSRSGNLNYPMKYEYSDHVPYKTLSTPATQHPPLWSLSAGILGKLFHTDNSFRILKVACFLTGLLLLAAAFYFSRLNFTGISQNAWIIALFLFSTSPLLSDFSANGSPFILCALELLLLSMLLTRFQWKNVLFYAASGLLCALSLLTHAAMFSLFFAFLCAAIIKRKEVYLPGALFFIFTFSIVLFPWIIYNLNLFGMPFYSYSRYDILKRLGLYEVNIYGNVMTTHKIHSLSLPVITFYITEIFKNAVLFLTEILSEAGIFVVALAIPGFVVIFQRNKEKGFLAALPFLCYTIVIFLWATHRHRYIVPLLAPVYLCAVAGFFVFKRHSSKIYRVAGKILLACAVLAHLYAFLDTHPSRYYADDAQIAHDYNVMLNVADILKEQPRGIILGYTDVLVGGVEAVYYHTMPFVHGRDILGNTKALKKLILDFLPRYIWTDTSRAQDILHLYPSANIFYTRAPFVIVDIKQ